MSQVEVLISAMNQKDSSIFKRTNIQSNALMINQSNDENYWEERQKYGLLRIFSSKERGLSNSRNMAIEKACGKYALLCDDDELLYDEYPQIIEKAFEDNPKADIICFQVKYNTKKYSNKAKKLGFLSSLKISSVQICLKIEAIKKKGITFDPNFGAGTPIGSGEENIFLYDCLKKGLYLYYVPICIGEVAQNNSTWFKGFNQLYFFNRGRIIRRMMGFIGGGAYCLYFVVSKYSRYKSNLTFKSACLNILKGFFV